MATRIRLFVLFLLLCPFVSFSWGDAVTDWNTITLNAIKTNMDASMRVPRTLAMVHAAVYEAVNSVDGTYRRYRLTGPAAVGASREAAAAAAAHRILISLYPAQTAALDAALATSLAALPDDASTDRGIALGRAVADEIIAWRATDGSTAMIPFTPGTAPGEWRPTPPDFTAAMLPWWGAVTPFVISSGSAFRPAPPPELISGAYADEVNRVKLVGARTTTARTPDQTQMAFFWAEGPGTVTTVGRWNEVAQAVTLQRGTSLEENARLFALLNLAMTDAGIAAWDAKYFHKRWRPITAIREAGTDANPLTDTDVAWEPLLPMTPPFPEYVSAHSTTSACAAAVLSSFFGTDAVSFSIAPYNVTPMTPSSRSYNSFSQAAVEAGDSRIYGGIHFDSGHEAGAAMGAAIADHVLTTTLLPNAAPATPSLISPAAGATKVDPSRVLFVWTRCGDPDAGDTVRYTVEYTSDPGAGVWTAIEVPAGGGGLAATGGIAFAALGMVGFSLPARNRRRALALLALCAMLAGGVLVSCGGDSGTADTMSATASLQADTVYSWRVTATDSSGARTTSGVSIFSTGQ